MPTTIRHIMLITTGKTDKHNQIPTRQSNNPVIMRNPAAAISTSGTDQTEGKETVWTDNLEEEPESSSGGSGTLIYLGTGAIILGIILLTLLAVFYIRKRNKTNNENVASPSTSKSANTTSTQASKTSGDGQNMALCGDEKTKLKQKQAAKSTDAPLKLTKAIVVAAEQPKTTEVQAKKEGKQIKSPPQTSLKTNKAVITAGGQRPKTAPVLNEKAAVVDTPFSDSKKTEKLTWKLDAPSGGSDEQNGKVLDRMAMETTTISAYKGPAPAKKKIMESNLSLPTVQRTNKRKPQQKTPVIAKTVSKKTGGAAAKKKQGALEGAHLTMPDYG